MNRLTYWHPPVRAFVAATLALLIAVSAFGAPASADTAGQRSTRTLILSGLVAAAAIVLYNNYHHKQVAANSVVGYTRDGGVVHGDGRITYPDGTVLYTGTRNAQRCSYVGYGVPCGQQAYAYRRYANQGYANRGTYANQRPYYAPQNQQPYYARPVARPVAQPVARPRADRDDRRDRDDRKRHHAHPNNNENDNNNNDDGGNRGN